VSESERGEEKKCGYVREPGSIYGSGANVLKLNFITDDLNRFDNNSFWLEVLGKHIEL
jgi:hypothetical protein